VVADLEWKNHQLSKAVIHSQKGGKIKIRYKENQWDLSLASGSSRTISL